MTKLYFSPRTYTALRLFTQSGHDGFMTLDEFSTIDQRVVGGLGRRNDPLIHRINSNTFGLTKAGHAALSQMESADIYRRFQSTAIAKCFLPKKLQVVVTPRVRSKQRKIA